MVGIYNKMSSVMSFSFKVVELCVVTINDKPWTHAKEVCKVLQHNKRIADIIKAFCSKGKFGSQVSVERVHRCREVRGLAQGLEKR